MSKIVFKGKTKDGISYLIRYPKRTDLNEFWHYINKLSKEKTFISFQGEEISLKEERQWVNSIIKKIKEGKSVQLIVEIDKKIVGVSGIDLQNRVARHVGTFGISIAAGFRNKGIGKNLMEQVINEARKNIRDLKIIHLECFANNPTACNLYKSFGFKEYGKLPNGISYKDGFVDEILMYHEIKS